MSESVYEYQNEIFKLKVTGKNTGRYQAYCNRIGVEEDSDESFVEMTTPNGKSMVKPCFYETRYFVRCDFHDSSIKNAFINHKMASVADSFDFDGKTLVGTLDFVNSPGKFHFEIVWYRGNVRESAAFEWMVVSEKLNVQSDYKEIVDTIEENAPGLVRAFLAKSKGQAGLITRSDTSDAIWADIFGEIADSYQRACEWVANRPHLKYVSEIEYRKAGQVKHWTPGLVNRYAMMSPAARNVAYFRTEHISPQIDTIENRFVKFTLKSITNRIESFAKICEAHTTISENFIKDLHDRGTALAKISLMPFFASVGRFTGFHQENMVLQRKQGYAEIYASWIMLQKTIDTTQSGFLVGHRPISALYEFWCFLRIADMLEKDFQFGKPEGRIEGARVYEDLFEEPDPDKIDQTTLSALSYQYPEKDGMVVKLLYQQNYGQESKNGDLAFYNPQRPDIVLVIERSKKTFTYLFDAKYRIDTKEGLDASPAEPINDMHRYRDAILYRSQEDDHKLSRQIIGAYVLYPGRPAPQSYDYADLIMNENIGAIPLLPGEEGSATLKKFIKVIRDKKDAYTHLHAIIPTRGTAVVVSSNAAEFVADEVVYGTYHSWQFDWIKKQKLYNMPVDKAKEIGIDDEASAKARSVLFLVSGAQGHKEKPSVFRIKRGSAKIVTQKELVDKYNYKSEKPDNEKEYWLWELDI